MRYSLYTVCSIVSLLVFLDGATSHLNDDDYGGHALMQFNLEHELVKGKFTKRALLSLQSYISEHVGYRAEAELADEDLAAILKLAADQDIYRARVLFTVGNKAEYVYGFVYACDLVNSGLRDNITLTFSSHGHLSGLHISVGNAAYESCRLPADDASAEVSQRLRVLPRSFATHAIAARPVQGPAPETQIYIARMEEEKKRKQAAEQGDSRSFLAKYWMYMVPVAVVFMMMSNAADPNAQGGGS